MTDQGARYDRIAAGYGRCWAPILRRDAEAVLDLIAPAVAAGARRILDVGTGTGTLAIAAIERWPTVDVVGLDASGGMIAVARAEAAARLPRRDRRRFTTEVAFADRMPFAAGSFDLAVTSFVLQLVPSRYRALREIRRVLRPRGRLALVTWLRGGPPLEADDAFDDALDDLDLEPRATGGSSDDLASVTAAAGSLRRAGFSDVTATGATLEHRFDVAGYLGFLEEFDEEDRFAALEPGVRDRLRARIRERLNELGPDALVLEAPIVYATGLVSRRGA